MFHDMAAALSKGPTCVSTNAVEFAQDLSCFRSAVVFTLVAELVKGPAIYM